jgi:hypothetical protein
MNDTHHDSLVEDLVDHPKFAPARRVPPLKPIAKWFANLLRVFREGTPNELPTRDGCRLG